MCMIDTTIFHATRSALRILMGNDRAFGLGTENIFLIIAILAVNGRKINDERVDTKEGFGDLFLTMVFS
jgi:hypothetical protein